MFQQVESAMARYLPRLCKWFVLILDPPWTRCDSSGGWLAYRTTMMCLLHLQYPHLAKILPRLKIRFSVHLERRIRNCSEIMIPKTTTMSTISLLLLEHKKSTVRMYSTYRIRYAVVVSSTVECTLHIRDFPRHLFMPSIHRSIRQSQQFTGCTKIQFPSHS